MSSITIVGAGQKKGCYYYRPLFSLSLRAVVESGEKCAGWSGYRGLSCCWIQFDCYADKRHPNITSVLLRSRGHSCGFDSFGCDTAQSSGQWRFRFLQKSVASSLGSNVLEREESHEGKPRRGLKQRLSGNQRSDGRISMWNCNCDSSL